MPTRTELLVGWLALFGVSIWLLACVALLVWWQRWRARPSKRARWAAMAEATRHVAAVAARTTEVTRAWEEAQHRSRAAEDAQAAAWQELTQVGRAYEQAVRDHREAARRSAERVADPTAGRELTHAAFAAYRRGDLSQDQLLTVSQWAAGWDAGLERCERELARLRVARREALLRHRSAGSRARVAREQLEVVEVQARALAEEAAEAAEEAGMTP